MRTLLLGTLLSTWLLGSLLAQSVVSDDRLPPDSVELRRGEPPATSTPWQLPKPGDPLYVAEKEAQIARENTLRGREATHHLVRLFERGIFKGYEMLQWGEPAKKLDSVFTPNPALPPDAIELSATEHPAKSEYFPSRPEKRPWNVPDGCIAVRVFHRGELLGWTFMPKDEVMLLHQPKTN